MNKSLKLLLATLLIGGSALSFSSCKDSENVSDGPTPEEMAQSKESDTAKDLLSVLSFTSELDSLPDNWYTNSYTVEPTVGVVNDASTPYVRYVPVLNKEEAIAKYNSIANEIISEDATSASWNIENVGSLKFSVLNQSDVTATLDVNIKQQPHLSQIRFVPASVLGNNATVSGTPYYTFGDIVELTEGSNKSYWICVRPCSQIEEKGKSHWMSFNLNDWDSQEKNGVPEESVNMKKLPKSGYSDYFLPTQLGNKSESREHLQNLFKLLMILDSPSKYANFPDGLGGIGKGELTQDKVEEISNFWESKKYWKTVLPKHVARVDIAGCFNRETPEVNVFYYGYHTWRSTASVHRAILQGANLRLASDGELKWTRSAAAVDFHDYANYGLKKVENEIDENLTNLPTEGFIVRYKTGRQLVGQSGKNDEDPTHSFEAKHKGTLKDIYVYRDFKQNAEMGSSVIGDAITDEDNSSETCAMHYSKDNPEYLGNNSYYFKYKKISENREEVVLQDMEVSTIAYINLLNAVIRWKCALTAKSFIASLDDEYKAGLTMLYNGVLASSHQELEDLLELRFIDTNGNEYDKNDENSKLAKVTINMPYKDNTLYKTQYRLATLECDILDKTYSVKPHSSAYSAAKGKSMFELRAYSDLGTNSPIIGKNQKFTKALSVNRSGVKKATTAFIQNIIEKIK